MLLSRLSVVVIKNKWDHAILAALHGEKNLLYSHFPGGWVGTATRVCSHCPGEGV